MWTGTWRNNNVTLGWQDKIFLHNFLHLAEKKYRVLPLKNCTALKRGQFKAFQMGWKSDPRVHLKPDMAENWLDPQNETARVWDDICCAAPGTHRLVQMTEWWTSEKSFEISGDNTGQSTYLELTAQQFSYLARSLKSAPPTVYTVCTTSICPLLQSE